MTEGIAVELKHHTMGDLFAQLGLPNQQADMLRFVSSHQPLPEGLPLADAAIWTEAQSRFLRDSLREDADWAEVVDQLNLMLHELP